MTDITEDVEQSTDDVQSTSINYDADDTFYYVANTQLITGTIQGWRFQTVDIPQGATINSAELTFAGIPSCGNFGVGCKSICYGVDADDIDTWEEFENNPNNADKTTASDTYNTTANFTPDGTYAIFAFDDLTAVVQEIVDRPGWVSGNDMAFVTLDNGSTAGFLKQNKLKAYTWDNVGNGTPAPQLTVTYTTAEGTKFKLQIEDSWKSMPLFKLQSEDTWKDFTSFKLNYGDEWKDL